MISPVALRFSQRPDGRDAVFVANAFTLRRVHRPHREAANVTKAIWFQKSTSPRLSPFRRTVIT
jgi:hypothetical protein